MVRWKDYLIKATHNLFGLLVVLWLKHKHAAVAILCKHSLVDLAPCAVFGCNIAIANKFVAIITRLVDCIVDMHSSELCAQRLKELYDIVTLAVCVADIKCGKEDN